MAMLAAIPATAAPADPLPPLWNAFAKAMKEYADGLPQGINSKVNLEAAVHAWRRMEKEMKWDKIL